MRIKDCAVITLILMTLFSALPISYVAPKAPPSTSSLPEVHPDSISRPASLTALGVPPYTPLEIQKAYNFLPLYARGIQGNNTRIAIIDAFGSSSLQTDLANFDSLTGLPPATVNIYFPDGAPRQKNSGWALETSLDVEWAHAIAPDATIDLVVAVDSSLISIFDGVSFVSNSLTADNVLSMSFGLSESLYPTTGSFTIAAFHQLFVTITSHGTTPVASSGDSGASSCCNVQYPSSDPLVIAVGGTSLFLNPDASYSSEVAWSGSTAGSSLVFPKPSWQAGLGDSMRDVTDVSYDANPNTGVIVVLGNRLFAVGGTSAGAPQWASLVALAGQANSAKYGAANQLLYKISTYHDVTTGSNGFFSATIGWDYPTGLGSPNANSTVKALSPSVPVAVANMVNFQGFTVTTNGTLTVNVGALSLTGLVTATARNSSTGILLFSKTYVVPSLKLQNRSSAFQSVFLLNVAVSPYPLSSDIAVTLTGGAADVAVQVTRQVDINLSGSVDIVDFSVVALAYGSTVGSPKYNPQADLDANGVVNIIDLGIVGFFYGALDLK
jgi:subtilase family serine protease